MPPEIGAIFGLAGFMVSIVTLIRLRAAGILPGRFERRHGLMTNDHSDEVLAELKALKQQIGEMQSTNNQFSLGFDESLTRMESRVGHLETKTAGAAATSEEAATLRGGQQS